MKKTSIKIFQFISIFIATFVMMSIYGLIISFLFKIMFGFEINYRVIGIISLVFGIFPAVHIVLGDYIPKVKFYLKRN